MKKILTSIAIMFTLLFFCTQILLNSKEVMESVIFSFNIWKNNIFPSLFPFFVISSLLINYGFVEMVSELFKPIMNKLFKIKGEASFVFIMSLLSGFPSSAKYVRDLRIHNILSKEEASKLLTFTHFSNPLFILGTLSISFLNNKKIGLLILVIHYSTNILIGILFRNYYPSKINKSKVSIKNSILNMNKKRISNKDSFGTIISNSILSSINTLLLVLGSVTTFLIILTVLSNVLNLNGFNQAFLGGILEMTQGLKYVSLLDTSLKIKASLSTFIISFGGLSVHMQIISIISDTDIKYYPYLLARIIHAVVSSILIYIIL